jgi:hypothetical protein
MENKKINALCIALCTDEFKYLEDDSHYIHIPKSLFITWTNTLKLNSMCFELSNPINPMGPKIYLKKIEPSTGEFESNILLPDWVCKKLSIQMCGEQVNIIPISKPNCIKRCKIRGNNSSYIKMDIKTLLEDKINQFKCVNLNTVFTINKIKFTIVELISTNDISIDYGITTDELEIDFDIPDDIKLIERRKIISEKITKKIEEKINSINEFKNKFNAKKTGIFKFNDYMESQQSKLNSFNPNIEWDEIHKNLISELEVEFQNDPDELEENIKILQDSINEGKSIQKNMDEIKLLNSANSSDSPNSPNSPNEKSKQNIFSTKGYKLCESDKSNNENPIILTKEEIKKARLDKLTKND